MIKSTNLAWGFYGTMKSNYGMEDSAVEILFDVVAEKMVNQFGISAEKAVQYLDSTYGRHLADSLSYTGMKEGFGVEMALRAYNEYASYNRGRWIQKGLSELKQGGSYVDEF